MGTSRQVVPVLASLVLLLGCDRTPSPVAPSPRAPGLATAADPGSGRIAFVSARDGNNEIYLVNGDGTGLTRLTDDPAADVDPAWSSDGTRLAFTSTRDGHNNVYVMNVDGTGVTQLTTSTGSVGSQQPSWCGNKIVYVTDDYLPPIPNIWVMNDDGTGKTRLTLGNANFERSPAWSPGCAKIAYTLENQVYVMNPDASGRIQLGEGFHPAWSPDGSRIAFMSDRADYSLWQIYVMNADGTGQVALTNTYSNEDYPAWSPDGTQIAFESNRTPVGTYIMSADGSGPTYFTDGAWDTRAAWFASSGSPPQNQPPVAAFTASCSGLSCTFISQSSDPDGSIASYSWDFGDGQTATEQNPSYTYTAGGTYTVALEVTDNQGATNTVSQAVTVVAATAGRIAFVSSRDGNAEIYVMNADGSGVTRLTDDPASDFYPTWSPDGSRIAFTSTRDGHNNIYVMNADGSGVTQLTTSTSPFGSQAPAWCGTRIAYMSDDYYEEFPDVYVMNDDGTGQTRLTLDNAAFDEFPSWSPDCTQIAYTTDPSGKEQIVVMNADGSGATQLTSGGINSHFAAHPAWSPDGSRIAFMSDRADHSLWQIYVMNADGTGQTALTNTNSNEDFPTWSPDGTQIAFSSSRVPHGTYIMNADGSGTTYFADGVWASRAAWIGSSAPLAPRDPLRAGRNAPPRRTLTKP
ncbi:MAG TPA: PKD domain-containing protein [Gemmatimonadales bacterium]|nr:PKD domain-containing protein [Gemmatimonadales bacterium]